MVKRPQALVAVGALLVGAAVSSLLLNLYGGVQRKMTREFNAYGPNVILAPVKSASSVASNSVVGRLDDTGRDGAVQDRGLRGSDGSLMDENVLSHLALLQPKSSWTLAPMLYVVMQVSRVGAGSEGSAGPAQAPEPVVAVGADFGALRRLNPNWHVEGSAGGLEPRTCAVGARVAARFHLRQGDTLELRTAGAVGATPSVEEHTPAADREFSVSDVISSGSAEDDQVFVALRELQQATGLEGRISLVQIDLAGEPAEVERTADSLSGMFPGIDAHLVGQIVDAEGKVLETIRWVLASLTALILLIIALCVMATMTAIILERRKDVAVMKALGASDHLVMRLFLSEAVALGVIGGLAGSGVGVFLARDLGGRLFGVTLNLAAWTFPVVCVSSILMAVLSTLFPVRMVRSISPATVLKGQ